MSQYYNDYPPNAGAPPSKPQGLCGSTCCTAVGGIVQVLLGILSIAFGAVVISSGPLGLVYQFYIPLWAGSMYLIAGSFGALIICCKFTDEFWRSCLAAVYIIFSVIAALSALAQAGWESYLAFAFGLASSFYCDALNSDSAAGFADALSVGCSDFNLVYYMHIALGIIGAIEFFVAIIGTIMGCLVCCGDEDTQNDNPMVVTGQNMQPPADAYNGYPQETNMMSYGQNPPQYVHSQMSYAQRPSRYAQSPAAASYYNGYGRNHPEVYYNGNDRASYQPAGYM